MKKENRFLHASDLHKKVKFHERFKNAIRYLLNEEWGATENALQMDVCHKIKTNRKWLRINVLFVKDTLGNFYIDGMDIFIMGGKYSVQLANLQITHTKK